MRPRPHPSAPSVAGKLFSSPQDSVHTSRSIDIVMASSQNEPNPGAAA